MVKVYYSKLAISNSICYCHGESFTIPKSHHSNIFYLDGGHSSQSSSSCKLYSAYALFYSFLADVIISMHRHQPTKKISTLIEGKIITFHQLTLIIIRLSSISNLHQPKSNVYFPVSYVPCLIINF